LKAFWYILFVVRECRAVPVGAGRGHPGPSGVGRSLVLVTASSGFRIPEVDTDYRIPELVISSQFNIFKCYSGVSVHPYSGVRRWIIFVGDISLKYKLAYGMRNKLISHLMHSNLIYRVIDIFKLRGKGKTWFDVQYAYVAIPKNSNNQIVLHFSRGTCPQIERN
jgi:hypothetical protein